MAATPQIRANWSKMTIGCAKRLTAEGRQPQVLDAIPDEVRGRVRAAGMLAWHDAALFVELVDAIHSSVGSDGATDFWKAVMHTALERALLRPLVKGAVGLYGRRPMTLLRFASQAWGLVSRGCGVMRIEERATGPALVIEKTPPVVHGCPAFIDVWHGGSMEALERMGSTALIARPAGFDGDQVVLQIEKSWTTD